MLSSMACLCHTDAAAHRQTNDVRTRCCAILTAAESKLNATRSRATAIEAAPPRHPSHLKSRALAHTDGLPGSISVKRRELSEACVSH